MKYQVTTIIECDQPRQANAVMSERLGFDEDYGFEYTLDWDRARPVEEIPDLEEVRRLLGFALFNLTKGKAAGASVILRTAYRDLTGEEWDGDKKGEAHEPIGDSGQN